MSHSMEARSKPEVRGAPNDVNGVPVLQTAGSRPGGEPGGVVSRPEGPAGGLTRDTGSAGRPW